MAPAMRALATRTMASAAASVSSPSGWPTWASMAARAARTHAYDRLGWSTAISMIHADNAASLRLAARLGCTYEKDFVHATLGPMQVWRHPGPEAVQ